MATQSTTDRIRAALDALGKSAEEIRRSLKRRRIKGRYHEPRQCPLARFLSAKGFDRPAVGGGVIITGEGDGFGFLKMRTREADFVRSFDAGLYPELLEA